MASTRMHNGELPAGFPPNSTIDAARGSKSGHPEIAPGEIAVGVVIGRASEYFDFFVYVMASVLVLPARQSLSTVRPSMR